jgi:nitroimidazol reductase NimA-like FMN-containing flavoprotein (pyridoxamine 5'-phosphate oxidase superfamily)
MRKLKEEEFEPFIANFAWGTLCTVTSDGKPYAIEFSYFYQDGKIYAIINPKGTTGMNIAENNSVCFKICETDAKNRKYRAVSCFGTAKYRPPETEEGIIAAWKDLAIALGRKETAFKGVWHRFDPVSKPLPLLEITIDKITGVTNYGQGDCF